MDSTVAKSTAYIDHVGADVIVGRVAVTTWRSQPLSSQESAIATLGATPGVAEATGIIRRR
jgi:hypothetical protein